MSKPFFFRIEAAELLNFATDPEGEGMSLLRFSKELQKGESEVVFIQQIIDEARNYIEKKKKAGSKGGKAKASGAKAVPSGAVANHSIPLASNRSSTVTETTKPKKTMGRFAPPTIEEVKDYCQERNNFVDPEKFIDFYSSNGWKVGKNKMVDWKACVRTWEKSSKPEEKKIKPRLRK